LKQFEQALSQIQLPADATQLQTSLKEFKTKAKSLFKSKVIGGEIEEAKLLLSTKLEEISQ
jgi:hypothetical protein